MEFEPNEFTSTEFNLLVPNRVWLATSKYIIYPEDDQLVIYYIGSNSTEYFNQNLDELGLPSNIKFNNKFERSDGIIILFKREGNIVVYIDPETLDVYRLQDPQNLIPNIVTTLHSTTLILLGVIGEKLYVAKSYAPNKIYILTIMFDPQHNNMFFDNTDVIEWHPSRIPVKYSFMNYVGSRTASIRLVYIIPGHDNQPLYLFIVSKRNRYDQKSPVYLVVYDPSQHYYDFEDSIVKISHKSMEYKDGNFLVIENGLSYVYNVYDEYEVQIANARIFPQILYIDSNITILEDQSLTKIEVIFSGRSSSSKYH